LSAKVDPLERRVLSFIGEYALISGGETVLVAVSAGPDSVCLLHLLNSLKVELGIKLYIAHLDHGLRGVEAEADAAYVSELAAKLGLPIESEKRDVRTWNEQRRTSLEEAAREVRYHFLDDVARQVRASRVAVGHTRDDQVETVLLHYIRGSGISGLRGLRPAAPMPYGKRDDGIYVVRPLLTVTRQETAEYCNQHGLQPRNDTSNQQTRFLRNRVRLELIPLLRQYNAGIEEALLRLADVAGEDADFVDEQASQVFAQTASSEGALTCLDSGKLRGVPLALQRRVFRIALEQACGSLRDIEAGHIDSLARLLFAATGKCMHLPGGLIATNERGRLVISKPGTSPCPWAALNTSYTLNIPGESTLPGWQVKAEILKESFYREDDIFSASLDLDKTGRMLTVRGRQPGDRFHPLGMTHKRKLQDFMVDAAIPRSWRDSVPIMCSQGQIIWVVGWRIDDRVKVTSSTQQVLRLEFSRKDRV